MSFVALVLAALLAGFWLGAAAWWVGGWSYALGVSMILVASGVGSAIITRIAMRRHS